MMSWSRSRKVRAALLVCGLGVACQFVPRGCWDYGVIQAVTAFDMCSVVNCNGGTFFDFCNPVPLLADCPVQQTQTP